MAESGDIGRRDDKHARLCTNGRKVCLHYDRVSGSIRIDRRIVVERYGRSEAAEAIPVRTIGAAEQRLQHSCVRRRRFSQLERLLRQFGNSIGRHISRPKCAAYIPRQRTGFESQFEMYWRLAIEGRRRKPENTIFPCVEQ